MAGGRWWSALPEVERCGAGQFYAGGGLSRRSWRVDCVSPVRCQCSFARLCHTGSKCASSGEIFQELLRYAFRVVLPRILGALLYYPWRGRCVVRLPTPPGALPPRDRRRDRGCESVCVMVIQMMMRLHGNFFRVV